MEIKEEAGKTEIKGTRTKIESGKMGTGAGNTRSEAKAEIKSEKKQTELGKSEAVKAEGGQEHKKKVQMKSS